MSTNLAQARAKAFNQFLANVRTPLLYNYWYVAAYSDEIDDSLKERWILKRPVVMYRKQDGTPVALRNRCPHRSYPLSKGRLSSDNIICGYHGMEFNSEGVCVNVPSQKQCPSNVRTRAYPLVETGPVVWIWMGEPEAADPARIPSLPFLTNEGYAYNLGYSHCPGSYMLMHENLMDLTHFNYLHAASFNPAEEYISAGVETEVTDETVTFTRDLGYTVTPSFFPPSLQKEVKKMTQSEGGSFRSPAVHDGWEYLKDGAGKIKYRSYITHFLTPESESSCHYFYCFSRNYLIGDKAYTSKIKEMLQGAFQEDMDATADMQIILDRDPDAFEEIHVGSDKPGVEMRRLVKQLAEAEHGS